MRNERTVAPRPENASRKPFAAAVPIAVPVAVPPGEPYGWTH